MHLKMQAKTLARLCVESRTLSNDAAYIVPSFVYTRTPVAAVGSTDVDEEWHIPKYPDVLRATQAGGLVDPKDHFIRYGSYKEDRQPSPIAVDERFYLTRYPDIAGAVRNGQLASAREHFDQLGFPGGRMPYEGVLSILMESDKECGAPE